MTHGLRLRNKSFNYQVGIFSKRILEAFNNEKSKIE